MHMLVENAIFSQQLVPQSITGNASYVEAAGARIQVGQGEFITFLVEVGAMAASSTLDVRIIQANAASSGTSKVVTGAALTQIPVATGASKVYAIEVKADQLDQAGGYNWVNAQYNGSNTHAILLSIMAIQHKVRGPVTSGLTEAVKVA